MSFLYVGQVVTKRFVFSGTVTGTPTAQVYVDGVATGSAVNGTGSNATWVFAVTIPTANVGDWVSVVASGTVSTVTQYGTLAEGAIVEIYQLDGGAITQDTPVTTSGSLAGPIVASDDYLDTDERAFIWYVDPYDASTTNWTCSFGGQDEYGNDWLVNGTITATTVSGADKWKLTFELATTDTAPLLGKLKYTVALESPTNDRITVQRGSGNAVASYT